MHTSELVRVERQAEIALVIAHHPPVNTITAEVRAGLRDARGRIGQMLGLEAVVLLCEGSTFFSGADIGEFSGPPQEREFHTLFGAFENLAIPVVAAMHGTVLGGGLEIALACHYRIAVDSARFGMPEVTLGIIPGAGGTQRMPRLIGAEKTLDLILSARPIDASQARVLGLLDEIVGKDLRAAAIRFARSLASAGKGPRRTSAMTVDPASATDAMFAAMAQRARTQYRNRTAGLVAVEAVRAATTLPFEAGLERETRLVNECKQTEESKGAIHVFFAERATRRIPGLPDNIETRRVQSAGIVGAGTMGTGIAICFANAGIPVTLVDETSEALQRGRSSIERVYQAMLDRGRITVDQKTARLSLIQLSLEYQDLRAADLIIEAVFENMDLKHKIFGVLDRIAKPGAVLATNTSTLDIEAIGNATQRPADVIGMHFFSPANVMPLLEVVQTSMTSLSTIRTVMELAKPLRKTPVLAKVCYGFIGNRMMEGYAREAQRMVLEGATPRQVDVALEEWGMAMGILAVFDMAGIDVGVNVHEANADRFPPDPTYYQADRALYETGRLGQKNGRGYYRYQPGDRSRIDDPEAIAILRARAQQLGIEQREHSKIEIVERCLYPLLNEGLRILEEGVALRASDIDVVWTSGYGFPRYRGGPMFYADTIGPATLLSGLSRYRSMFGPVHWQPSRLLVQLVEQGISLAQWESQRRSLS